MAAKLAERWLVEVAGRPDIAQAIGGAEIADRSVHFQRLLTYSERSTLRKKYDQSLNSILKDFRASIVVRMKASRNDQHVQDVLEPQQAHGIFIPQAQIAFVGQSFAESDQVINNVIQRFLRALNLEVLTGEKPRAASVSKKVRDRIERSEIFVGVFTKRDKIEGKSEWTTSSWVIDEKAYALARGKKLILLKEQGVNSIGGLQGDYEYLEFDRVNLSELLIPLLEMFMNDE
jgi:hypothetical protein